MLVAVRETGSQPSDEELEARWKAGSAPAFATLFERYHRRVYAFAYRLTSNAHTAEDIAQRAFLNLYKKPPPGTGRATFKSLLFTVARNESLNEIKRRGRRREAPIDKVPEEPDGSAAPDEQARSREDTRMLREALTELSEDEREIVLLRTAEGLTFREVCDVTGLSRDAVRWRLAKGLEKLRAALSGAKGS